MQYNMSQQSDTNRGTASSMTPTFSERYISMLRLWHRRCRLHNTPTINFQPPALVDVLEAAAAATCLIRIQCSTFFLVENIFETTHLQHCPYQLLLVVFWSLLLL